MEASGLGLPFFEEQVDRFDVPEARQAALVSAYVAGQPIDSDDPSSVAVAVDTLQIGDVTHTVERFADGSFRASGVEAFTEVDSQVAARSVTGCTRYVGAGGYSFSGCKVEQNTPANHFWFHANFSQYAGGSNISSVWGRQRESAQTCSLDSFGVTRANGTGSTPAMATMWDDVHGQLVRFLV